jgi:hypothetical protein
LLYAFSTLKKGRTSTSAFQLQKETFKLLIEDQLLYETALLCLYNTSYRDVKHLCASTLYFVLEHPEALGFTERRAACGTAVAYILFSSLLSTKDNASAFSDTSLDDCTMAILGCGCWLNGSEAS